MESLKYGFNKCLEANDTREIIQKKERERERKSQRNKQKSKKKKKTDTNHNYVCSDNVQGIPKVFIQQCDAVLIGLKHIRMHTHSHTYTHIYLHACTLTYTCTHENTAIADAA